MRTRVFEPTTTRETSDDVIILPNEIAAGVGDHQANTAQALAERTGQRVLAFMRPFSEDSTPILTARNNRRYIAQNPDDYMCGIANNLADILDMVGFSRLNIAGHSSAASLAIGLINADVLPIKSAFLSDPPGLTIRSFGRTELRYLSFAALDDVGVYATLPEPEPEPLYKPYPDPRFTTSLTRLVRELITNGAICSTDFAAKGLEQIAANRKVNTRLILPETTMTNSPSGQKNLAERLNSIGDDNKFSAHYLAGHYHSLTLDPHVFAELVNDHLNSQPLEYTLAKLAISQDAVQQPLKRRLGNLKQRLPTAESQH